MKPNNWKQILTSILVGACVAFMTTLFEGLADFLKSHSQEVIAGASAAFYNISRNMKV